MKSAISAAAAALGRKGGASKSEAKREAARINGAAGGRRMKVARIEGRHEGTWRYICGGAQIRTYERQISGGGYPPIDEIRWLRVKVPGLIFGTPEDWDSALQSAAAAAWGE